MVRIYSVKCKRADGRTYLLLRTAGVESVCVLEQGKAVLRMPEELTWASQILLNPGQLHDPAFIDKFEVNGVNGWEDVPRGFVLGFELADSTRVEVAFQTGASLVYRMDPKTKTGQYVPVKDICVGAVVWCSTAEQYGRILDARSL